MASLFGDKTSTLAGKMQFGTSKIQIGGNSSGLIVQSVQAQMERPISKLYEIGSLNMYYIAGRLKGQGVLRNVIGPVNNSIEGMTKFGKLCPAGGENDIVVSAPDGTDICSSKDPVLSKKLVYKDAALMGVTINAQAEQDIISGDWSYMFSDLQVA